jgi:hypothetical protein
MDWQARERAITLILNGTAPALALLLAKAGEDGVATRWIVSPTGPISKTPDPQCVARHLEGVDPLTREAVERALDACTQ